MGLWSNWNLLVTIIVFLPTISYAGFSPKLSVRNNDHRVLRSHTNDSVEYDPRTPLLLSPLIDSGHLNRARRLSQVNGVPGMNRKSYSGFLTARPEDEANLFFWFLPADVNSSSAPVLLWLNGGPGSSSLGGLFGENGPYTVTTNLTLEYRPDHWATVFNMLYIDCPVGTGFSFAKSINEYSNNSKDIGTDLHRVLVQFFTIFDDYSDNDFYVAGESYGARYCVTLAKVIHENQSDCRLNIRLKGVMAISALFGTDRLDPIIEYLYQVGLFGPENYEAANLLNAQYLEAIRIGNYSLAANILQTFLVGSATTSGISFLTWAAGITTGESMLLTVDPPVFQDFAKFVVKPKVRLAIHVGNQTFSQYSREVQDPMQDEFVQNFNGILEELLVEGYKVLMMSGNLDMFVPPLLYRNITFGLQWNHTEGFRRSSRIIWKVDPRDADVAGYSNCDHNLCLVLVRNAGHRMPNDQIRSTLDAARRFAFDIPFN